jgi:hypothetical protein
MLEAICAEDLGSPVPPQAMALDHLTAKGTRVALQTLMKLETAIHAVRRWRR